MSAIAKDASITLITAVPGSGKTLRAVWYMVEAVAAGEQVFACNVNGLKVDGVTPFPDPTKWEDLPRGAILIVDECQRFFRQGRAVPDYIAAMETIRHMGIRLVLLTQHSGLIHGNIGKLVGRHEHLVRENGKESSIVYTRSRLIANTGSDKTLASEDHHTWVFPKQCYDLYESAEVHTVQRTIPFKYKRAAIFALVAGSLLSYVIYTVNNATAADAAEVGHAGTATGQLAQASKQKPAIGSAEQYAEQVQPLIPDAPFTALGFVNRPFASDPQVFCMSSGRMRGENWNADTCTCLTEQGTRYEMPIATCAQVARHGGRYNPYKIPDTAMSQPTPDTERLDEKDTPVEGAETVAGAGIGARYGDIAGYGSMGVGASPR